MAKPGTPSPIESSEEDTADEARPACVMVFNASDPSGAGGLSGDAITVASVGAHALPVVCGAYIRDTAEVFSHVAMDDEAVTEQAEAVLEDIQVQVFKVGFVGSPENLAAIAELASDYPTVPMVTYMPDLSWWDMERIEAYLEACQDLLLPQTTVLVGNHSTLRRWLLPDWSGERAPSARDLAKAASAFGVAYTMVTGAPQADQHLENTIASPQVVVGSERFERFDATFTGAGDTLSAALAALLATGCDLAEASSEALSYLDHALSAGYRLGMGHVLPDRMFWAQSEEDAQDASEDSATASDDAPDNDHPNSPAALAAVGDPSITIKTLIKLPGNDTQH